MSLESELRNYLKKLGVTKKEVLENTPKRWMKFLKEFSVGFKEFKDVKSFEVSEKGYNQMVVFKTNFTSLCEHHLLPFFGEVWVGYAPRTYVVGVSKIVKLINHISKKPTIQEELTEEIATNIKKMIPDSLGVIVVVKAFHTCVSSRYKDGWLTTSSLHGIFKHNPFAKEEFFEIMKIKGVEK